MGAESVFSKNTRTYAEKKIFTTRFAGVRRRSEREENTMWRLFRPQKYCGQNKRHGFSKEIIEREERSCVFSFSWYCFKEPLRHFIRRVLAPHKMPQHSLRLSSPCILRVSSEAGGEKYSRLRGAKSILALCKLAFFTGGHLFDQIFRLRGGGTAYEFDHCQKFPGRMSTGIPGTTPVLMGGKTSGHIQRNPGVNAPILAFNEVEKPRLACFPSHLFIVPFRHATNVHKARMNGKLSDSDEEGPSLGTKREDFTTDLH